MADYLYIKRELKDFSNVVMHTPTLPMFKVSVQQKLFKTIKSCHTTDLPLVVPY